MGKMITFWSPYAGHGMATSSLCAVAGGFALRYPECKIAISHAQAQELSLAGKLDNREQDYRKRELYDNLGINALKMYIRKRELTDEIIEKCGIPLPMKSVFFYPNMSITESDTSIVFQILTQQLIRSYDVVFVDLESGNRKEAYRYMKAADLAIVVLPTEPAFIERFLMENEQYLEQIKYGVVFGGSLAESKYSSKFYRKSKNKTFGERILGEIYRSAAYFDAMCEGRTLEFFLRNQMAVKKEENYEFICQAKKTAESIGRKINLT